jgi:ABC-type uncharacterized transport system substrate-binding protein
MFNRKPIKAPFSRIFFAFMGIVALFLLPGKSSSHPHVFIESELEIELGVQDIKGIWHHWTFDEYFSAWIIDEFDLDGDGLFSPEETENLYQEAFKNLETYGFWTRVLEGSREIPVTRIENFTVLINDNKAVYSFFVPLDIPVVSGTDIFIAVYDEDFYCQIFFPPGDITFKGNTSKWKIDYDTQKMPELTYYFGFITPVAVRVSITPS